MHIRDRISHVSEDRVLSEDIEKMSRIMDEREFIALAH
jgi:histidine ammonia-lyase